MKLTFLIEVVYNSEEIKTCDNSEEICPSIRKPLITLCGDIGLIMHDN